ncbi:MAG: hypothetical protein WBF22_13595, partial [Methylocella sp.]
MGLANLDLLNQGSHAFAKLERCKLGPALRKLCRSVKHGSLGRGVKAERRDGVTDVRTRREERAQTVERQPLMSPAGMRRPLGCSERLRVISAVAIEDQARQQT